MSCQSLDAALAAFRKVLNQSTPPTEVRQAPFDYIEGHCQRLADPDGPVDMTDFCDYFLDYQYMPVQRDLLAWVLPLAIDGYQRMVLRRPMRPEFEKPWHMEGMWEAFDARPLFPEFLSEDAYRALCDVWRELILMLIRRETGLAHTGQGASPYVWMHLHATLIYLFPVAGPMWSRWWQFGQPGEAVAGLQWLSGFLYESGDNPIFAPWTGVSGGGAPMPFETLMLGKRPADPGNVEYLTRTLTPDWAQDCLTRAAAVLQRAEGHAVARQMLEEFEYRRVLFEERVPLFLKSLKLENRYMIIRWDDLRDR